ncbi:acyl-CoA Delta(11) desaturase-like isoform X2 [Dinothrombium tinctorium]|uniref:Acyl-CoA Delta(11) desaturase-like isoform X2 n=1 Tax=Dinothrombium tinctorium TaxID=1965070 RepID=A0A3S3P7P4_9ACAR|nr:acyl-CoA Delta(11) desaturase-like isoform X2 [Dinothrombium tinctorium]
MDSKQRENSEVNAVFEKDEYEVKLVWRNIILFVFLHLSLFYGVYLFLKEKDTLLFCWQLIWGYLGGLGVTAGAHRLWAHRSYKARLPLRIFLAYCFILAGQNDIYEWCRDHRVHHKFSDTDADPHNSTRGFFFSHMGWLCVRKHLKVKEKGRTIDLSDLTRDPVVRLQRNAAHYWGYRPYASKISPRESPFVIVCNPLGEGFHNYHHTFPQDYKASEYGWFLQLNITAAFIDLMALIGQAYDLKTADKKTVELHKIRALKCQN